ncbi:glycosyltransferase family 32 protein [Candidatus Paracaedibacter symbiosus]|uniref:glycosyltransferase family 32 protein n=1 Tax=Candidatus Paracaedibacter symbiosus TaxID=244582 RepID=UPI0005095C54|nr:glycosyltransferase [Candidatus Paracaedibacter symbiosus]
MEIEPDKIFTFSSKDICLKADVQAPNVFINLEKSAGRYTLLLSLKEISYTPQFVPFVDFKPIFLQFQPTNKPLLVPYGPLYAVNPPTNLNRSFKEQYDGHLNYLFDCLFLNEGIDPKAYFEKLNTLYKKNYFPYLFNQASSTIQKPRIPGFIHAIWLTHEENPIEFPDEFIKFTLESLKACPSQQGFKHILWVYSKDKLPETVARFASTDIEVREISLLGDFELKTYFLEELKNKKFGRASDIFRLVALEKYGGVYRDVDYRIHQSLRPLLNNYNFVAAREPMSSFICNAFIASSPRHPVITEYLSLIKRNYDPLRVKKYISTIPDTNCFGTILITGPGAFTVAVAKAIDSEKKDIDIIFSHETLYPTPEHAYPQITVVKPDESVPPEALGVHYWKSTWTEKSKYGSKG